MPDLSMVFDLLARDRASSEVRKVGDSMDDAGRRADGFGGMVGKAMGVAAGAIATFQIGSTLKDFVVDAAESERISRLTAAAIESTGGAAHISADQVGDLATSLSNKTAIDDEAIQSASNLLLTFTKVRNEAGEGNDIFDQATESALNMSTAMGTDANAAAMQLGKALNDPIKGVASLGKAGVQFTADQKKTIASLVESGNVLDAQKIILGELETQFGGAAAAAADPMARLTTIAGNLGESIGGKLLPYVDTFATFVTDRVLPGVGALWDLVSAGDFTGEFREAFGVEEDSPVVGWIFDARDRIGRMWDGLGNVWESLDLSGLGTRALDAAKAAGGDLIDGFRQGLDTGDWSAFGTSLAGAIGTALSGLGSAGASLFTGMSNLIGSVDWGTLGMEFGKQAPTLLLGLVTGILNFDFASMWNFVIANWFELLLAALTIFFLPAKLVGKIGEILAKVPLVGSFLKWGWEAIVGLVDNVGGWIGDVISSFVRGITGGGGRITGAFGKWFDDVYTYVVIWGGDVLGWFRALPGKIVDAAGNLGSALYNVGRNLVQGLLNGAGSLLANIGRFFLDLVPGWIRGPFEKALGIKSPSKVFAEYGRNIGQGLIVGIADMRPAVGDELARLADTHAYGLLADMGVGGGGLGYRPPGYDMASGGAAAGGDGVTHTTIVSGVVGPEEVAAIVRRDQRTTEFLAGGS